MLLWFSAAYAWAQSIACLSTWLPVVVGQLTRWLQDKNCENTLLNLFHPQKPVSSAKMILPVESKNTFFQINWVWKCCFGSLLHTHAAVCQNVINLIFSVRHNYTILVFLAFVCSLVDIWTKFPPVFQCMSWWEHFAAQHIKLFFTLYQKIYFFFFPAPTSIWQRQQCTFFPS